jgi:hypothetical protein
MGMITTKLPYMIHHAAHSKPIGWHRALQHLNKAVSYIVTTTQGILFSITGKGVQSSKVASKKNKSKVNTKINGGGECCGQHDRL